MKPTTSIATSPGWDASRKPVERILIGLDRGHFSLIFVCGGQNYTKIPEDHQRSPEGPKGDANTLTISEDDPNPSEDFRR